VNSRADSNFSQDQSKRNDKKKKRITPKVKCNEIPLPQPSPEIFREIECYEPLIFNILERSKDFYEKDWKVKLELFLDKQLIRISSQCHGSLERLNSSINTMIKKLIKIQIEYKENEYNIVTKKLKEFKDKHKNQKHIRIVYIHLVEEKTFNLGVTSYSNRGNGELELLKKEIIDGNLNVVGNELEFLIIFNYKSNLDSLVKTHLSNILDLDESQVNSFIIEEALMIEYNPEKSKLLRMNEYQNIEDKFTLMFIDFDLVYTKHNELVAKTDQLKDLKLVKLVKTNKLIFEISKMNTIDCVNRFLNTEHKLVDFRIEHICFGLFVIIFTNRKDKGL
jgi:hypothetical protein